MSMAAISLDHAVAIPEHVAHQKLDDELVLVNLDTSIYYGLNPVGTRLWELLTEGGTLRAARDRMADEYEVAPDQLELDILRLVGELEAKGLLTVRSA